MGIINYIFLQILVMLYKLTSFQVWGINFAQFADTARDYVVHSPVILALQLILIPISIMLFVGIVRVGRQHHELNEKLLAQQAAVPTEGDPDKPLMSKWQEIMQHIESIREGEWKFAIIEADKVVDDVLKNSFAGETMGERLMNIDKTQLLSIDGLWEAHKIRNRLAHDMNYFLRHAEAVRAIRLYEETLKELGAL